MAITAAQVKEIRQELDKLRPTSALSGNRELSVKQTILALAPALERMKKRGFEMTEITAKLAEKGIEVKAQTLAKYLAEARRQKDARKTKGQASCHIAPRRRRLVAMREPRTQTPPQTDQYITGQEIAYGEKHY